MISPFKKALLCTVVPISLLGFAMTSSHAADEFDVPTDAELMHDERAIQAINEVVAEAQLIVSGVVDLIDSAGLRNIILGDLFANAEAREALLTTLRDDTIVIRNDTATIRDDTITIRDDTATIRDDTIVVRDEALKQTDLQQQQLTASTGTKVIPDLTAGDFPETRLGGLGLREIGESAIENESTGVALIDDSIAAIRDTYYLDTTFAAIADPQYDMRVMKAHHASQGVAALATAETAYKRSNASMARLEGYANDVFATADIKASIDLNTVVLLEIAQQLNESLRTQAAIASMSGLRIMSDAAELSTGKEFFSTRGFNR